MSKVAQSIGHRLRRARESRGLSRHDVADRTKLPITVVAAIERDDFDSLPFGMYRKAYLRTVAIECGVDPEEIASQYATMFDPPSLQLAEQSQQRELIRELTQPTRHSLLTLAVSFALAVAWFIFGH